jgi:hypothetical protein
LEGINYNLSIIAVCALVLIPEKIGRFPPEASGLSGILDKPFEFLQSVEIALPLYSK